ncbi:MAG: hypothetical protein M1820_000650 [Bogoriella megaspora]|nr:MAG: hypothetical protein M1820_000650 [Bogoriella megaspora]
MATIVHFEETIRGMKKALKREDNASDSDESISQPTNRGNKLKRKAKYVQEGTLGDQNCPNAYKKRIEHAGYYRNIISRNPIRLDEDGDEIDEDDVSEGDNYNEDDPYSGISFEELLGPLTSVPDLCKHPGLSVPYNSKAIAELAQQASEMVRRESASLWRMKQLFTKLRGDEVWVPCGTFETGNERQLFGQNQSINGDHTSPSLSRLVPNDELAPALTPKVSEGQSVMQVPTETVNKEVIADQGMVNGITSTNGAKHREAGSESQLPIDQIMTGGSVKGKDDPPSQKDVQIAGTEVVDHQKKDTEPQAFNTSQENGHTLNAQDNDGDSELPDADAETTSSEPLSHRMTTRAQAKAPFSKEPSDSPPSTEDTWVHPIFSVPVSALPDRDMGLPSEQADDVRKFLTLYVQKQEEIVRGVTSLYNGLLRAKRMKDDVFKWSKAEGHIGEMSDGEDWYDKEEWGLEADLVKGKDEEEDDTNQTGKKTRQRRQ